MLRIEFTSRLRCRRHWWSNNIPHRLCWWDGDRLCCALPPPAIFPLTPHLPHLPLPLHPLGPSVCHHYWLIVILKWRVERVMILSSHFHWLTCTIIIAFCGVFADKHKNKNKRWLSRHVESDSTWCDNCQFGNLRQAILTLIGKYLGMGGGAESCCQKIRYSLEIFLALLFAKSSFKKRLPAPKNGRNK